ncbi:olfactory receptor 14J1-like [Elgaria multicarinata webbii]|uniref:olfactory receptor 14J1-like n=1 Tax=Elgaria multicarinata webbii TaxID=159646 RepID=UPI002FCD50D0
MSNNLSSSEFLLLEFSEVRELQILHSVVFLVLYLSVVSGNLLIISAVALDHRLNSPMYFFLFNLAMQDLGQVTVIIPKSMANSLMNTRHISYSGCIVQLLLFIFFLSSDFFLLTVMAYDRYVAICNPLHYEMVMNRQACIEMVASVWISGLVFGMLHTSGTFATPFCSNAVNQFFCAIPQLLKLACWEVNAIEIGVVLLSVVIALGCFIFIIVSYVQIFTTVLRMPSVQGRQKAFLTCLPHLIVFSILVLSGWLSYLCTISDTTSHLDLAFAVIYTIVPPLLNPVIYSMRNKEFKAALSKLLHLGNSSNS